MLISELVTLLARVIDTRLDASVCTPLIQDSRCELEGDIDFPRAGTQMVYAVVDEASQPSMLSMLMPLHDLTSLQKIVNYVLCAAHFMARASGPSKTVDELDERVQTAVSLIFSAFLRHLQGVNAEASRRVILLEVRTGPSPYVAISANGITCNTPALAAWGAAMMLEANARAYAEHMIKLDDSLRLQEVCRLMLAVAKTPKSHDPLVFLNLLSTMHFRPKLPILLS